MAKGTKKKRKGFLADYKLHETYLLKPDRLSGRPGILRGQDPLGRDVLVKLWPRKKAVDDSDFEEIWRSEIRQLQRLAAMPKADELFVQMLRSGKDTEGFYLVLDPGSGSPLEVFLKSSRRPGILAQPRLPRNRRALWVNLRRIAEGIELLHSQGAIHRNMDSWAVLTAFSEYPDFKLTGFEWSMRVAAVDQKHKKGLSGSSGKQNSASFIHDWHDFASVIASLLNISEKQLLDTKVIPSKVSEGTSVAEVKLLRAMLGVERVNPLDGDYVCGRIDEIVDAIAAEAAGREARLCLAVRVGVGSRLANAIRKASNQEIETSDQDQQVQFIIRDLSAEPLLVACTSNQPDVFDYLILGRHLAYGITPFRRPGTDDRSDWEFAVCERADSERPNSRVIKGSSALDPAVLDIVATAEATKIFPRRRGRVQRWDHYLTRSLPPEIKKTEQDNVHQAFALLLVLEMAYAASDVFPVKIVSTVNERSGDNYILRVRPHEDADRAKLSKALKLQSPAVRLGKLLQGEDLREEGSWILSETGVLGERSNDTKWRFLEVTEEGNAEVLKFEGQNAPQSLETAFLAPAGMVGRTRQFKRRVKALSSLRQHTEVLRMLVDQRERIDDSQDPLDESEGAFKELDPSKQAALREILGTIPLFMLQGPPGVGKTFMVADLVRRRLADEPTTRLLLTAQSNAAIDHLMNEIQPLFENRTSIPVMVRARPSGDDEDDGDLALDRQADRLLADLDKSDLVKKEAPRAIRERIGHLAAVRRGSDEKKRNNTRVINQRIRAELRALEGMILRAANLVFSTTNSAAIERLVEERGLFDWSIVEEAGKATGGELISPLLLSHRRLMIGDHKQLPPFDSDKLTKILSRPEDVRSAILASEELISRYLKDPGIDDLFNEVKVGGEFGRTCSDTLAVLTLFETFVEKEFKRQKLHDGRRIARRLNEQHRMHPAIARIVSDCFYDGQLTTFPKKSEEFIKGKSPVNSKNIGRLPETPVVFVDLPYSREEIGKRRSGDTSPPWSNQYEVNAAIRVLELIRPAATSNPTLAILSPYREQVKRLRESVARRLDGELAHLSGFRPAIDQHEWCGTVDSFQGGEADFVLVSLVRNNVHSNPARALGFLRDDRRMNVLLSRAKWRMVLIGSLGFYRQVIEGASDIPGADIGFLGLLLQALEAGEKKKEVSIVSLDQLEGINT